MLDFRVVFEVTLLMKNNTSKSEEIKSSCKIVTLLTPDKK